MALTHISRGEHGVDSLNGDNLGVCRVLTILLNGVVGDRSRI
tara:strand:+ start:358 stop:483 length:126 start_codon:yes stop_codon:yes gene_type:complete